MGRALDDDDPAAPAPPCARAVRGVHGRGTQSAQEHARAELQHPFRQLLSAVGTVGPLRLTQAAKDRRTRVMRVTNKLRRSGPEANGHLLRRGNGDLWCTCDSDDHDNREGIVCTRRPS